MAVSTDLATDFHVHLAPEATSVSHLPGVDARADGSWSLDGRALGPPELHQPARLVASLCANSTPRGVVSIPPPLFRQHLDHTSSARWVEAINDGLVSAIAGHPALRPLAYLPLEHPRLAIDEARRRRGAPWAGFVGAAGGRSRSLADPELADLWGQIGGRLLLLHPGTSSDRRLDAFYLSNLLGNPVETALAAGELVFGEVLRRHPEVRVLLAHGGGCVPSVVGRWEHGVAMRRPGVPELRERPRQAVRRLWVDTIVHDDAVLDLAAQTFGEDRLVLGSDWPFPMGVDDPRTSVMSRGSAFTDRVARTNAAALLPEAAPAAP